MSAPRSDKQLEADYAIGVKVAQAMKCIHAEAAYAVTNPRPDGNRDSITAIKFMIDALETDLAPKSLPVADVAHD